MKIIRITTNNEISKHEFPEGAWDHRQESLCKLIGNNCRMVEHVMPKRLYTELKQPDTPTHIKGRCVSILVDEEGALKPNEANSFGCYLYETDKHGCPIMGNILIIGEYIKEDGIEFSGIDDMIFKKLYRQCKDLLQKIGE